MKRFTKGLLALFLVVSVLATACAFTGVFANAQAMQENVGIKFDGTDRNNTWVTLSGTKIQDSALEVNISNGAGNKPIVLLSWVANSNGISLDGWQRDRVLAGGEDVSIGVSGNCTAEAVLSITVTYYVQGNPVDATKETCTAYIFASAKQTYPDGGDNASSFCTSSGSANIFGGVKLEGKNTIKISPVNSASKSTYTTKDSPIRVPAKAIGMSWFSAKKSDVSNQKVTAAVYVDGNRVKNWDDGAFSLKFTFSEGGSRAKAIIDKISITQTSDTGTMKIYDCQTSPTTKSATAEYDYSNNTGVYIETAENSSTEFAVNGTIPSEDSSKFTIVFRSAGMADGVSDTGFEAGGTTPYYTHTFELTVYNVNKGALLNQLNEYSLEGLNQKSYTNASWTTYYNKLIAAYKVLGTLNATKAQVTTALSEVKAAHNSLVRYAVVITNHYYYVGDDNTNPVLIDGQTTYDMQVTNGTTYAAKTLAEGSYQITVEDEDGDPVAKDIVFNRTNTQSSVRVNVGASNNYTQVINQYYWNVDTTELEAAIQAQENKRHLDEDNNEMYTSDSWEAYAEAAAAGRRILSDKTLFQVNIDDATYNLDYAAKNLVRIDINTDWLAEGMEWAAQIVENSYDTTYSEAYGWDSEQLFNSDYAQSRYQNLVSVYNTTVEMIEADDYTQAEADAASRNLWAAINALRIKDSKGIMLSDKVRHANSARYGWFISLGNPENKDDPRGLSTVLEDILDNTQGEYRLNKSDFTEESWNNLMFAIYGEYDTDTFDDSFFTPEQFDEAALLLGNEGGQTPEAYPVDSDAEELTVPAYSMLNNIWFLPSQVDYNACTDNLVDKVNNLEWVVDTSELEQQMAAAQEIDPSLYTKKTSDRLENDIDYVQTMLEKLEEPQLYGDPTAITSSSIDDAVAEIADAIASLKLKPTLVPVDSSVEISEAGEQAIITGETVDKTAAEIIEDFSINNDSEDVQVTIYDAEDNEVDESANVGTGYKMVLSSLDGEEVYEEHTFIIKGDVVGNAEVDNADFDLVFSYSFTHSGIEADSIYFMAGDVNGDGKVDLSDAIMINRMSAK